MNTALIIVNVDNLTNFLIQIYFLFSGKQLKQFQSKKLFCVLRQFFLQAMGNFVKDIKVIVKKMTRNCHKMATYYFVKKMDRGIFVFCVITFEPYQLRFRPV